MYRTMRAQMKLKFLYYPSLTSVTAVKKLSVDRNLIQGNLWKSGNWNLEISLGGAVRVESDNNEAREGMDDLDFIAEAGPALQYYFSGDRLNDNALFLTLPVRSAISTDFTDISARGFTFNPTLTWRRGYTSDHRLVRPQITFGLRSASDAYHHYIYGVDRRFETHSREEYDGEAGYGGFTLSYSTSIRWKDYLLAGFVRYSNISGAVFEDSPLVRQNENFLFGAAFAYLF